VIGAAQLARPLSAKPDHAPRDKGLPEGVDEPRFHVRAASEQSNPELVRLALKLATGAGKTVLYGDADRVADRQRGAPSWQPVVLAGLPGDYTAHRDQSAARQARKTARQRGLGAPSAKSA